LDELIEEKHLTRKGMVIALAIATVIVLALLATAVFVVRTVEINSDIADYREQAPPSPAYLDVVVRVSTVELNQETLNMDVEVLRAGDLLTRPALLKQDITVSAISTGLKESGVLSAGEEGDVFQLVDTMKGNVADYPWDTHTSTMVLSAEMTDETGRTVPVPMKMKYYGALQGLDVNITIVTTGKGSVKEMQTTVIRSTVTTIMVCFSILLIWVLIATVVIMVLYVVVLKHELQMMMFAFFGTLLFAMTSFRNAMPGTPPMGVLSDYVAFFWGYLTAIVGIGILTVVWVRRLPHADKEKKHG
jgi:hypothetical protein